MSESEKVRYNVAMPKSLREDAKANAERGELAEEVRDLFRRTAYGTAEKEAVTETERVKAELREVRRQVDEYRAKRDRIDAKISTKEARATRLEERLSELEQERSEMEASLDVLENMLQNGERMWPTRIKNAVDVDADTAHKLFAELKAQNNELPDAAFTEPGVHDPTDWRDADA